MSITRSLSATAVLLAASQSCGFVSTRHHRHRRINRYSLAPSVAYTELHHLHLESAWDGRRDASSGKDAPITKPGLVTQLGGWSYARTLFSDSKGFRQDNSDGEESGTGRDTLQSAPSDGGSTTTATSNPGSRLSSTDDGGDDDDDDDNNAWDADGHNNEEFEITCNGDVCERRPVASPGVAGTVVDKHDHDRIDGEARADEKDNGLSQLISMGWDANESAMALAEAEGNVLVAAEALAAREEDDLERYKGGLAELMGKGWDEDTALSAMREAGGNTTAALMALEDDDRMLSMQFERSIEEMVEHGWDEEVARKALLMQWQKDIENGAGGRKAQKQFEKTVQGVKAQGEKEGLGGTSKEGGKKRDPSPATEPTPAKRDDVVFDVTDKNLQKVVFESPVPVILDVYADWCGPCKQLTPALEEAAMRSGGMFRLGKVDAEKHRVIAEVLGIRAYPSIFGVKEGVIVDNFVGILPQEEMQAFMMGLIVGLPPNKDKPRREHQRGEAELRSLSRKLAHIAGLAAIGSRKKEQLCRKVDRALSEMLPDMAERDCSKSSKDIALAKRAGKVVSTILMSAYKFPEDPKFRRLSTSGTVYTNVLAVHPPMLEVLRVAGFRKMDGDDNYLHLLHRNMAVLASVKDRVELWDKSVKVPTITINDEDNIEEGKEDHEDKHDGHEYQSNLEETKLKITKSGVEGVIDLQMAADATLRDVFEVLQEGEELDENLVLTTNFPKRELSASDPSVLSSTLLSLGLVPSARLILTDSASLAAAKVTKEQQSEMEAKRKEGLRERMIDKSQEGRREKRKKRGTLFGVEDGIVQVEKGKHVEYFGGDSTVTIAGDGEETDDTDSDDDTLRAGMGEGPSFPEEEDENEIVDQGDYEESGSEYDVSLDDSDGDGCFMYDSSETEEEW